MNNDRRIPKEQLLTTELPNKMSYSNTIGEASEFIGKAMDRYAEQESCAFAFWISINGYQHYSEGWCQAGGSNGWHCTTKELYDIFNQKTKTV